MPPLPRANVENRSRIGKVLIRFLLSLESRIYPTIAFQFGKRVVYMYSDRSAPYHAVGSTDKLWRLVESTPFTPDLVVDIGANCGIFSAFVDEKFPDATIVAIEPNPEMEHVIRLNLPRVKLFTVGAGSKCGKLEFCVTRGSQQSTFLVNHRDYLEGEGVAKTITVPVVPVDDVVRHYLQGAQRVMVKIDVQGYEPEVVRGARELMKRTDALFLESAWVFPESIGLVEELCREFEFTNGYVINAVSTGADILLTKRDLAPCCSSIASFHLIAGSRIQSSYN